MPINVLLITSSFFYFAIVVCGFCISIPTGITTSNFKGQCILYADVTLANATYGTIEFSNYLSCAFITFVPVFVCILYGLGMAIYHTLYTMKSFKEEHIARSMWIMPWILMNCLMLIVVFIASCMISVGFHRLCSGLTKGSLFKTCHNAQGMQLSNSPDSNTSTFYNFFTVAETASWINFLLWITVLCLSILRFYRNRKARSQNPYEDFSTKDKTPVVE